MARHDHARAVVLRVDDDGAEHGEELVGRGSVDQQVVERRERPGDDRAETEERRIGPAVVAVSTMIVKTTTPGTRVTSMFEPIQASRSWDSRPATSRPTGCASSASARAATAARRVRGGC